MKKKSLYLNVRTEELQRTLKGLINSEHSQLISEVIINNLTETSVGLEQLWKALAGVSVVIPFKVLDEIMVPLNNLSTWRMNKALMQEKGLIKKDLVQCTITDINPYAREAIKLNYKVIKDDGSSEEITTLLDPFTENIQLVSPDFIG